MALVTCEDCGTVQEYSIFEGTTPCRACGASADRLSPVGDDLGDHPGHDTNATPGDSSGDNPSAIPGDGPGDNSSANNPGHSPGDDQRDDPNTDPADPESYTVLVVEDDDDFRETVRQWSVIDDRWEVREAANGREALAVVDEDVDVIVLDRRMPELTGTELVERLGETAFDGDVLVVSAYEADHDLSEADVDGYVTKPVSRETYVNALERIARF